jgi:hypothetical protein
MSDQGQGVTIDRQETLILEKSPDYPIRIYFRADSY